MIDFDALVLAPAMLTFARPVTVTPRKSQPDAAAYSAEGIWSSRHDDVPLEDGGILSVQNITLGVRLSDFEVAPVKGDLVLVPAAGSYPAAGLFEIDDTDEDGQGGAIWTLKETTA